MQQYTECLLVEIAITPSKSIRNAKIGGVMKNLGYLNIWIEEKMTEKMKPEVARPLKK